MELRSHMPNGRASQALRKFRQFAFVRSLSTVVPYIFVQLSSICCQTANLTPSAKTAVAGGAKGSRYGFKCTHHALSYQSILSVKSIAAVPFLYTKIQKLRTPAMEFWLLAGCHSPRIGGVVSLPSVAVEMMSHKSR